MRGARHRQMLATLIVLVLVAAGSRFVLAQDGTPVAVSEGWSAWIDAGSCAAPTTQVFALNPVTSPADAATPIVENGATPVVGVGAEPMPGLNMDEVIAESRTIINASLAEMSSADDVIVVSDSAGVAACGSLGASVGSSSQLQVDLLQLNDSRVEGLALIESSDENASLVTIMLIPDEEQEEPAEATPAASPAAST